MKHSRVQFATLTEQSKELAALAQRVTFAAAEPLKAAAAAWVVAELGWLAA